MPKMIPSEDEYEEDENLFSGDEQASSSDEEVGPGKGLTGSGLYQQRSVKRKRRSKKGQGQHRRNLWTQKVSHLSSGFPLLNFSFFNLDVEKAGRGV